MTSVSVVGLDGKGVEVESDFVVAVDLVKRDTPVEAEREGGVEVHHVVEVTVVVEISVGLVVVGAGEERRVIIDGAS